MKVAIEFSMSQLVYNKPNLQSQNLSPTFAKSLQE